MIYFQVTMSYAVDIIVSECKLDLRIWMLDLHDWMLDLQVPDKILYLSSCVDLEGGLGIWTS